ncbi:hypothetical protein HDU93_000748 [Gonapodya sp. JEL0774]|nr:hypothetical protein HDU93_000748 [Gonapodya sp. JEL0774]
MTNPAQSQSHKSKINVTVPDTVTASPPQAKDLPHKAASNGDVASAAEPEVEKSTGAKGDVERKSREADVIFKPRETQTKTKENTTRSSPETSVGAPSEQNLPVGEAEVQPDEKPEISPAPCAKGETTSSTTTEPDMAAAMGGATTTTPKSTSINTDGAITTGSAAAEGRAFWGSLPPGSIESATEILPEIGDIIESVGGVEGVTAGGGEETTAVMGGVDETVDPTMKEPPQKKAKHD